MGARSTAREPIGRLRRPAAMAHRSRIAPVLLAAALLTAACSSGPASPAPASSLAGPSPTPSSSSSPSAQAAPDAIDHPTGASDVVVRVGERGGHVMINHLMARVPLFTLYGDGRVLLVPADTFREPGAPLREVRLNEAGIQAVLARALVQGGLGIAPPQVGEGLVMDLPETVFEVHAGGVDKAVVAGLLAAEPPPGPDAAAIRTLDALLTDLRSIPTSAEYVPPAFVAVIAESEPDAAQATSPWPWPDLPPGTFAQPADDAMVPFPGHLLTDDELAALTDSLGVPVGPGGATGLRFAGPDGKPYLVEVRPALPDELER